MGGMEMMLKAIGFDPEQFKQWMNELNTFALNIRDDIATIKRNQALIAEKLGVDLGEQNHVRSNGATDPARIGVDTTAG